LASSTFKAVQHRKAPSAPYCRTEDDDPLGELLGAPNPAPPMIDLSEAWTERNDRDGHAFTIKRPNRVGTTLELLAAIRLCATFADRDTVEAICDPAAITIVNVSHPDWIQPASLAMRDLLPDCILFNGFDEHKKGDLLIFAPHTTEDLSNAKEAAKFAKSIADGLDREVPILIILAGHRALPDSITRVLPHAIQLAPLDAEMVLAMLHLKFEDGEAGAHAALLNALPASDMLARLGIEALHAAFRAPHGMATVQTLADQAAALIPTGGPTLEEMDPASEVVIAARQMIGDLKLWSEGKLSWGECLHSILLHGAPGTGKTYLARAVGGSSGLPLFVGSIASWQASGHLGDFMRAMIGFFTTAIAAAPCVVFIDEFDSAGSRDSGDRNGSNYWRMLINGILEQIDVVMRAEGVVIIGACNNLAVLDPALIRPGRFDTIVEMPLPGRAGLTAMLQSQLGSDLGRAEIGDIITAAIGSTPAVIDAAIRGARSHARSLQQRVQAKDVIARLSNGGAPDPALLWRISIHECGHAILAIDRMLGTLRQVRIGHRDGQTLLNVDLGAGLLRDHKDLLAYTLAGRAAEAVIFGSIGSGSGGPMPTCDLAHANKIAWAIETSFGYGLSGLIWSPCDQANTSTDPVMRASVLTRLNTAESTARNVLEGHRVLLLEMAKDLMRHRILEGPALQIWIDRLTGDAPWNPDDPSGRRAAAEEAAIMEGNTVIHLRDYRVDAPS
jgi:hypothetical protein